MKSLKELLSTKRFSEKKNVSREYQSYGVWLATQLGDLEHKSLYIKLAKTRNRAELIKAYSFVIDYPSAKNRGKLFMWKLSNSAKEAETKENGATKKSFQK